MALCDLLCALNHVLDAPLPILFPLRDLLLDLKLSARDYQLLLLLLVFFRVLVHLKLLVQLFLSSLLHRFQLCLSDLLLLVDSFDEVLALVLLEDVIWSHLVDRLADSSQGYVCRFKFLAGVKLLLNFFELSHSVDDLLELGLVLASRFWVFGLAFDRPCEGFGKVGVAGLDHAFGSRAHLLLLGFSICDIAKVCIY